MTTRHGALSDFFLRLSDVSLVLASLGLTIVYRFSPAENPGFVFDFLSERIKVTNAIFGGLLLACWHGAFAAQGLYVSHRLSTLKQEVREVGRAIAISAAALLVAAQLGHWRTINFRTVAIFSALSFLLIGGMRIALRLNLRRLREGGPNVKTLLIIGAGRPGLRLAPQLAT